MWSFYKGSPDTINFNNSWHGNQTYLDKVKVCDTIEWPVCFRLYFSTYLPQYFIISLQWICKLLPAEKPMPNFKRILIPETVNKSLPVWDQSPLLTTFQQIQAL